MAEAAPALELRGLTAGHGETVVLEGLELALGAGESLSVLGRNGVGKTTLIDTIMGHTQVQAGKIRFCGREIVRWPPWRRARAGLGYVPQEREIFPSLSVREHLRIAARPGAWTIARAFEAFPALAGRRQHRGDALSGGGNVGAIRRNGRSLTRTGPWRPTEAGRVRTGARSGLNCRASG
jgi:branched-chain amino acid transport system ATP-binding protein